MIRGLLFDLDGVLVNTNPLHARAWQELAEELVIPLTPAAYEAFLGISRAQCLEILLKKGNRSLSESEKERLCTRKDDQHFDPGGAAAGRVGILTRCPGRGIPDSSWQCQQKCGVYPEKAGNYGVF